MTIPGQARKTVLMLAFGAIILGVFNVGIQARERILREGETVLLELAPRDPRSIMQGDYMRLNYRIGNDARETAKNLPDNIRRGDLVIRVDENNIGRFERIDDGTELHPSEKRVRFHRSGSWVRVMPDSFMFQEGHREYYDEAKYGMFRFDGADSYLLTGLADENRNRIVPPGTSASH